MTTEMRDLVEGGGDWTFKAPEDWRSPRPGGTFCGARIARQRLGVRQSSGAFPGARTFGCLLLFAVSFLRLPILASPAPDYSAVQAIFSQHCLDCHTSKDPEGSLVLEDFESLSKGGELGAAFVSKHSADSLLVQMIEGRFEKEGKKKIMPPGKRAKLTDEQIQTIRFWIDAGAIGPSNAITAIVLTVPHITPRVQPRNPIFSLAYCASAKVLASGRYGAIELRSATDLKLLRILAPHTGNVNAIAFSPDGLRMFSAGGQPGLAGEIKQWDVGTSKKVVSVAGHKDAIYALALSPDGKLLATGSYDQKIKLWEAASLKEVKTLSGHNGCIYDLWFRPDGKLLASASADRTIKLWDPESGERRDTLSQSLKELYAVTFSADGKNVVGGGGDNRLRLWQISEKAAETTNLLLESRFAHEGAILRVSFSPDGRSLASAADDGTIKIWEWPKLQEVLALEKQADWGSALLFLPENRLAVGRMDGTLSVYDSESGKLLFSTGASNNLAARNGK